MIIKLVRHGESELNCGMVKHEDQPNHQICLTPKGIEQAQAVGRQLGSDYLTNALLYRSPYLRTRQTMDNILKGAYLERAWLPNVNPKIYEDPRLREQDFGYSDPESQKPMRKEQGYFWYRYNGGESAADCSDRASAFLDSMIRQLDRKIARHAKHYQVEVEDMNDMDVLIVTHGIMVRAFVMRFLHLTVEQYEAIDNPENCDVVTIKRHRDIKNPQFVCGKWGVEGLRMR